MNNAVGIDVSEGKSMIAIILPFGEIISTHLKSTTLPLKSTN